MFELFRHQILKNSESNTNNNAIEEEPSMFLDISFGIIIFIISFITTQYLNLVKIYKDLGTSTNSMIFSIIPVLVYLIFRFFFGYVNMIADRKMKIDTPLHYFKNYFKYFTYIITFYIGFSFKTVREPLEHLYMSVIGNLPEMLFKRYEKDIMDSYLLWQRAYLMFFFYAVIFGIIEELFKGLVMLLVKLFRLTSTKINNKNNSHSRSGKTEKKE